LLVIIGLGLASAAVNLKAYYHFRNAERAVEHHRLKEAREQLDQCLKLWPESGRAHLLAGRLARRMGDFKHAKRHYDACYRAQGPSDDLALERILAQAQSGMMDKWATKLAPLIEEDESKAVLILEALSRGYMEAYRLPNAAYYLKLWLELEPDNPRALWWEGWVLELSGIRDLAAVDYKRSLESDPDNDEVRMGLANILMDTGWFAEAIAHFAELHERQPDNLDVMAHLAECLAELGEREMALQLLEDVLARQPHHPVALMVRGGLAYQEGDLANAELWLRKAISHKSIERQTRYLLYQCLRQAGKEKEAREQEEHLDRMVKDLYRIQVILTDKLAKEPRNPALLCEAGVIFLRAGDARQGVRWLESALAQDPDYQPAHAALAEHYEQAGQPQRAEAHRGVAATKAASR
jgi:tetratricopeptide (TPR) repeat protein